MQPRFTKRLDLFIKPDPDNARAAYAALAEFGAPLQAIRPADFADRRSFFRFGREPRGFDILPDIPGVDFDAAWGRRVETVIDPPSGVKANFISADDLIAAKLAAGRPQDIADADAIRKAIESQALPGSPPAFPSVAQAPRSENPSMSSHTDTAENKALVQASFDRWHAGTGSPFELLAPEADWTIVGSSPLSKTYSRQAFLDEVIQPFNARMATPLVPTVRGLYGDGDMVIILFDAAATTRDGLPYRNTYTWYFRMKNKRVVSTIAFFDTREFDEFWNRVSPAQ